MTLRRYKTSDPKFKIEFETFVNEKREATKDVSDTVRDIIKDVKARGDEAVCAYTNRFDRMNINADKLRLTDAEIKKAASECPADIRKALDTAVGRIRDFHAQQKPKDLSYTDALGNKMGARWTPIDAAGIYVPGGLATYPSTVYMTAVPAQCAGVNRIAMTVPTPGGDLSPVLMATIQILGIEEIYRIGGAQAVAALAYGTQSITPVDIICGPGNAFVAEAQRQVYGRVGIGLIAGPSEILVLADNKNDPAVTAMDLLSQAEHDETAQSVLITDDAAFAQEVADSVDKHLKTLPRAPIAAKSWADFGAIIVVGDLEREAPALVDAIAPEHIEIATDDPQNLLKRIRHAGSAFLGRHTPESAGDYIGGPNHVLPTGRGARFQSGLGTQDFMKRTTWLQCSEQGIQTLAPDIMTIAQAEGLQAHARSAELRMKNKS